MNPGSPVLTGNHPRLSVSRLNTRYSDVDFQRSRDVINNTDISSSQMYFKNQTFRSDSDDVIENGRVSEILYDSPRTSPMVRPKFYWWLVDDISQNRDCFIFIDDSELITHKLSHFYIFTVLLQLELQTGYVNPIYSVYSIYCVDTETCKLQLISDSSCTAKYRIPVDFSKAFGQNISFV